MPNKRNANKQKNTPTPPTTPKTSVREVIIWIIIILLAGYLGYLAFDKKLKFEPNSEEQTQANDSISQHSENNKNMPSTSNTLPLSIKQLNGTWNSLEGGSTISFTNNQYIMDFQSVDGGSNIKGAFRINGDTLLLTSSSSSLCSNETGLYLFKIENKQLMANIIQDNCVKRSSRMTRGWQK